MLKTYLNITNRMLNLLGGIAAFLLLLLVLLLAYNVVAPYLFDSYSIALDELAWHFYSAVFLLGIPYALKTQSHVRVDFLYDKWSKRTQAWIDLTGALLVLIPTCCIIIWSGWQFTSAAYGFGLQPDSLGQWFSQLIHQGIGEKSQDTGGLLNRWIIKGLIPFSFFCLLIAAINFMIEKICILKQTPSSKHTTRLSNIS